MHSRFALLAIVIFALTAHSADTPSATFPTISELPGPVVIAGEGKLSKEIREAFFALAGKDKAKIVVIAGQEKYSEPWPDDKSASLITVRATTDRKKADDPEFIKHLATATAVWFTDGKLEQMIATYRGTLLEKELKKLHERGGLVGGSGSGATLLSDAGLGILPDFLISKSVDQRFKAAIDAKPSLVGLSVPEGAAMIFQGRRTRVMGEKNITIRIAKGAGHPVATQEAEAGSLFDLFQLRRAALNRAAKTPFPPVKPRDPVVEKGSLVIVGGGGTTPTIMNTFFDKAGGKDAQIVVIPTTKEDGPGDAAYLRKFGATNVSVLFTLDRKLADDPKFSEALTKAGGVWFGGGRQWRFIDSFEGTLVEKRCHEVLARGGVIGGSSAGASIQSEYMPRGHPLGNTVMAAEGYERGFGFLPGCAVDQHFFARKRTADMTGLMKEYPQFLGIGIDESTAIVVTGGIAEVMGRSKVAFYDMRKKPVGDKDYEEVKAGEKYDLKKREKVK
ncbi:MAG TPA: Type 1 glutamine amidotransferase-like domain-containing protein [Urbifossiella sp.]